MCKEVIPIITGYQVLVGNHSKIEKKPFTYVKLTNTRTELLSTFPRDNIFQL